MHYRIFKIFLFISVLAISATKPIYAQNRGGIEVDIKIYFPYDVSYIDTTYMDNNQTLHLVDSLLKDTTYISTLYKIKVTAQSSPEGSMDYNKRLSQRRIESLKECFTTNYPHIDSTLWHFSSIAENWELFHQHLLEADDLPHREQVLDISNSDSDPDSKEWLLKTLDDGRVWLYIKKHILPSQRFGANVLFVPMIYAPIAKEPLFETKIITPQEEIPQYIPPVSEKSQLLFALKTNLVLDAMSVVNLAVEVPIGERWSVVAEVVYPWWRGEKNDFTMQVESYHAEIKYWLGDRETKEQLQGWSVGLYGGWGRYDIQPFSTTGVQGDFFDAGAQVGFAHQIARNLHLEYTVGLGYISTSYTDYKMAYDEQEYGYIKVIPYPWMTSSFKSILPTRCGVSLVWLIKSKGGDRR